MTQYFSIMEQNDSKKSVSLSRRMSKVGLLAAMKTFTRPHFQRKKKVKEPLVKYQQSRSWDSGLSNIGHHQYHGAVSPTTTLGTAGSYKRIYWPGLMITSTRVSRVSRVIIMMS